jgi:hypothetical protein
MMLPLERSTAVSDMAVYDLQIDQYKDHQ